MASAKSWGVERRLARDARRGQGARPVTSTSRVIVGGFYSPTRRRRRLAARGHADARARPRSPARSPSRRTPRCSGSTSRAGACGACAPRSGDVEAETVVICCGVWSPRLARMAGASIPLTPAVHQMIDIGPVPRFADAKSAIEYPIVRDMDTNMYERQDGSGLEVGSYAHRPILHDPEEIPSIEEAALSPTEFPFTEDDFVAADGARARADAGDRRRRVGGHQVRDQRPALADAGRPADPRRDARGRRASGRPPRCGSRRARASAARVAEWMVEGESGDRPPGVRHRPLLRAPARASST